MTDELDRRLTERVDAATPDTLSPLAEVVARRARRRARRRVGGVAAAAVAVGVVASVAALANGPSGERGGTPVATPSPSATRPSLVVPSGGTDGAPPPIVVRGDGPQVDAWQGSYCWGTACVDMIPPPWDDLPELGAAPSVEAGFADPGTTWSAGLAGGRQCARYPVFLAPTGAGRYDLTPSGPPGEYQLDIFVQSAEGGDTSGAARWTTPGAQAPASWAHLHQNGPHGGGGGGTLDVVLDGAAVDGEVSGTATVSGTDRTETFELAVDDQGCGGDRYVTLTPRGSVDRLVDGLGAGPFTYDVDVVVGGTHHRATATSADGAEDTPLTFEPALPE